MWSVKVNPTPQINNIPTAVALCSGATFNFSPNSTVTGAANTYSWTRAAVAGNPAMNGTGAISETLVNTTASPIQVIYKYVASANNCNGPVQDVVVTVNPNPTVTVVIAKNTICAGETTTITATPAGGSGSYTYIWSVPTGVTQPGSTTSSFSASVAGDYSVRVTDGKSCFVTSAKVTLTVTPLPTPAFTTSKDGQTIYSGDGPISLTGSPGSGTFTGTGVVNNNGTFSFNPCSLFASEPRDVLTKVVPITYTVTVNGCTSSVTKNITVNRSIYKVIVKAAPHPFCQGENVHYESYVYRDAEIIYPYLTNVYGEPVDAAGNLIKSGAGNFPVWNPAYPFPDGTPQIIKEQAFRYFQPKVISGTPLDKSLFTYQWTKNEEQNRKNDLWQTDDAGLSSQDYYGVKVTGKFCDATLTDQMSYRMYSADLPDYEVSLAVSPVPMCQSGPVTLTATLDGDFKFWGIANLKLEFILTRGGTQYPLGTVPYTNSDIIQLPYDPASTSLGSFIDGDKVHVNFISDIDAAIANTKCSGKSVSNAVTIRIEQPAAITVNPMAPAATCEGQSTSFSVSATGTNLVFTWFKVLNGITTQVPNSGNYRISSSTSGSTTTSTLTISNVTTNDGARYYATVANATTSVCRTSVNTSEVELVVNTLPRIAVQPLPDRLCEGASKTFTVFATGTGVNGGDLKYQWFKNGTAIPGATENTYTIPSVTAADQGKYSVQVTGTCTVVTSTVVDLTVDLPATLTTDLTTTPIVKCEGETATFSVSGTGTDLQFNWFKNDGTPVTATADSRITIVGSIIDGVTTSTLTITGLLKSDAGEYYAILNTASTTACSKTATTTGQELIVNTMPIALAMKGADYCPYNTDGVELILEGAQAGIMYELFNGTESLKTVTPTTDGNLSLGIYPAGTYTVVGTGEGTCINESVATATITSTLTNAGVTGDLEYEWIDQQTWKITALESGLPDDTYTFGASPRYVWYTKLIVGDESTWTFIKETPENFIILKDQPAGTEIKCEVYSTDKCQMLTMIVTGAVVPFPVELIEFKAAKQGDNVVLNWATAMEKDNTGFEVQVSNDGVNYRLLQFVPTKNANSSVKLTYTFTDTEKNKRLTRYYRLKQIDTNGTSEFFGPVSVNFGEFGESMTAYPNPFEADIYLDIETDVAGPMEVTLTDVTGRRILSKTIEVQQGKGTYTIQLEKTTPTGAYIITTRKGDQVKHFKLIKQ